jgi:hypothetical protein
MITAILSRSLKPLPVTSIIRLLKDDEAKKVSGDSALKTLKRHPDRFQRFDTSPQTWGPK